ncbi:MAG TPA: ATP-dependent 6-phosphofructokinase, partial [Flavobacteriales bacterium]|nr:ATP-dependent 6-phosphofructokinase [Flavobacteriales bacterium]
EAFDRKAVANIIHRGGTILKTARSERFLDEAYRAQAAKRLRNKDIDHLIIIGGDGTVRGAEVFIAEHGFKIVGCPGTIDNDLFGTDYTIGFDTAVNTVIESIDRLRDTAESHDRVFVVEVMGRDSGQIALHSALAAGAEAVLIPETKYDTEKLIDTLSNSRLGKASKIVIVGEGDESGGAYKIADSIKDYFPAFDVRVTVLGHTQRGGNPSFIDRKNASILGFEAVQEIYKGNSGIMLGFLNGKISRTPFEKVKKHNSEGIDYMLKIAQILAR